MSLDRIVAVKMILSGRLADEVDVRRFLTEARSAADLQHPNIVGVHEVGQQNGQYFFSMEYVDGQSLAALVRDNPLPPVRAARYVKIIAEAIHYAHGKGIVHRDLKPANILIDHFDQPRVTDFGLAKRVEGGTDLTAIGRRMGTPSYMPPEQASGRLGDIELKSKRTENSLAHYQKAQVMCELLQNAADASIRHQAEWDRSQAHYRLGTPDRCLVSRAQRTSIFESA